jgi:hypothetical protein
MAGGAEGEGARKGAEAKEEKPASPADAVKGLLKGILGR